MRRILVILAVFSLSALADEREAAKAFHRQEWMTWSKQTGFSVSVIERLYRKTMGGDADDRFGEGIETVDARSLRSRNHILFVTSAGNGHWRHTV